MSKEVSESVLVRQFTEESGSVIPDKPQLMDKSEVHFIVKMVIDEMLELYATVASPNESKLEMIKMVVDAKDIPQEFGTENYLIGQQADSLVDNIIYCQNAACKKGVNLSHIFKIVHQANMNKRDIESGKFLRRADNKIIKPVGWRPPNITAEIERQCREGFY
jgi:predicted HAD superfamily Cof-like phosphohydrolase